MDRVFDEVARLLASPLSRREAFSRLFRVAAGALAVGALATPAAAQAGRDCMTDNDCAGQQQCCGATAKTTGRCAPPTQVCCPPGSTTVSCPQNQVCCPDSGCSSSLGQCK